MRFRRYSPGTYQATTSVRIPSIQGATNVWVTLRKSETFGDWSISICTDGENYKVFDHVRCKKFADAAIERWKLLAMQQDTLSPKEIIPQDYR